MKLLKDWTKFEKSLLFTSVILVGLEKYLYKSGYKIDQTEYNNIINRYNKYIVNNKVEWISFTEDEFLETNI